MNNHQLYVKKIGQGYPLLMLHGNGEDHRSLEVLANQLKKDFTIYLIDSRGHGKSTGPIADTYDDMADDLIDFLHQKKLECVHVFGFSDGAIIALKALIKMPNLFKKLILCGMNISPDGLNNELINQIKNNYQTKKNPLLKLMLEGPIFNDCDLKRVSHDIHIYFGEHDAISIEHQERIKGLMTHAKYFILEGHTHDSYIIENDTLKDEILAFLKD